MTKGIKKGEIGTESYEKDYSETSFWEKLSKHAGNAGKKVVYTALLAYFALESPNVSGWAKLRIYGALGYFISFVDLVPDPIPVAGYGDDLAVLLFAVGQVAMCVDKEVRKKARSKMEGWFGSLDEEDRMIIDVEKTISEVEKVNDEGAVSEENRK
jgi:uncharacterized membrane protein YkvA (DUF1232 family)